MNNHEKKLWIKSVDGVFSYELSNSSRNFENFQVRNFDFFGSNIFESTIFEQVLLY